LCGVRRAGDTDAAGVAARRKVRRVRLLVAALVVAALAGCGDRSAITAGGEVPGTIVTVYVLVPYSPQGRDLVRGAKLALAEAGGRAGRLTVQFASLPEPADAEGIASAVRDIVHDTGTIAVIGDLDARTAAVSGPLLNAVGLLHVSPIAPTAIEQPSPRRTFFPVGPVARKAPAPPGFDAAFPGSAPGAHASAGYDAMKAVLAALRDAGARARSRQAVIDAFSAP
jgi:ABC-type branched-subunit amino acid transport system substrate-binding protein